MSITILGIESSCDDTSAAIIKDYKILANIIANQSVHKHYGGVVPELASRAHQQNIIPVIDHALKTANISKNGLDAVAFTRGPGLLGSLLVGTSFAKAFSLSMDIPMIEVDHMKAHILAHFIKENASSKVPNFPFLCLTVSGGHTQIVRVDDPYNFETIGETIDDAAGEAFDKAAKILGLPYPGGPEIDKHAQLGDPEKFSFAKPRIPELNYSFSGLKTSILYFVRDMLKVNENFIIENKHDLCASIQHTIVDILIKKLIRASKLTSIKEIAIAGGVSANSSLRSYLNDLKQKMDWNLYIPKFEYTTDNAAMIAMAGYFKFIKNDFATQDIFPYARKP